MIEPVQTRQQWMDRKAARADRSPVFVLPVHDERRRGRLVVPDVPELSEQGRARRRLARRLADELTNPPVPHTPGHDLMSVYAISLPVAELAAVEHAMRQSVVLPLQSPGSVWITEGDGGEVLFANGDTYSIVFVLAPDDGPILVLVDELPGYAVRVDEDDSQRGRLIMFEMKMGLMINLQAASTRARA